MVQKYKVIVTEFSDAGNIEKVTSSDEMEKDDALGLVNHLGELKVDNNLVVVLARVRPEILKNFN